jgi:hypothetical protein
MAEAAQGPGSDAYLEAFMHGFEFVLLAMRGRIAEEHVPADERAKLEAFLADYVRIVKAYRERADAKAAPGLAASVFRAEVTAALAN